MDQATSRAALNERTDGLNDKVAAVEEARARLGRDLDQLSTEVRSQVNDTMQRVTWKVSAAAVAVLAGLVARKGVTLLWRATVHREPPDEPASGEIRWTDALGWTVSTAVAVGVAQLVAKRGTAMGWQKATGSPPPI